MQLKHEYFFSLLSTQLASTLDLLPTIFNLVGAKVPDGTVLDGVDMAPVLFNHAHVSNARESGEFHVIGHLQLSLMLNTCLQPVVSVFLVRTQILFV